MTEYILGTPLQACEGLGEGDILPAGTRITVTGERAMIPHPRGTPENRPMRDASKPANGIRQDKVVITHDSHVQQ